MRSNVLAAMLLSAAAAPCQTFFPPAPTPTANPLTTQKALLGFVLFHEEQMSSDNTVACRSCHHFTSAGTDSRAHMTNAGYDGVYGTADDVIGSPGVAKRDASGRYVLRDGGFAAQVTPRKAPSMINVAYQDRLFYDGRARGGDFRDPLTGVVVATGPTALENLVLGPPLNPVEMGHPGRTWADVANKIAAATPLRLADQIPARIQQFIAGANYPMLFQRAFGTPDVTPVRIAFAVASYLRTLISDQSRFDFAIGSNMPLTALEAQGRTLFETRPGGATFGTAACTQCHGDVTATSHTSGPGAQATTMYGQTTTGNFHNTGVRPTFEDQGEGGISNTASEIGRFKVPMLRNVALHSTFMHTGRMQSLAEIVDFYSRGGDYHTNQAPEVTPRNLTVGEKAALVAFLNALTDPRVAAQVEPFDTVRLGSEHGTARPTQFGDASNGNGANIPVMVAQEPVFLGTPRATIGVHHVAPNSWVGLFVDSAGNPGGIDVLGLRLYVGSAETQLAALGISQTSFGGTGYFSTSFSVPNVPQLSGLVLTTQWLAMDTTAASGLTASAAAEVRL
jgi:cytochrome c peroxidase